MLSHFLWYRFFFFSKSVWASCVNIECCLYCGVFLYSLLEVDPPTMVAGTGSNHMIARGMQQCACMFGHLHSEKPAPALCM